jgi:hypothetical protein
LWLFGLLAGIVGLAGCSAESGVSPISSGAGGDRSEPPGSACPLDNLTRECTCRHETGEDPGRQVCDTETGWSECECASVPGTVDPVDPGSTVTSPSLNEKPETFDWLRTVPSGGSCEPGHYEGAFDGSYVTGAAPFPVMGNLNFDLGASTNGEFFEVSGGHMMGSALVIFPFEAEIVGTLDCTNGTFDGFLQNAFYVDTSGQNPMQGPFRAQYDKFNHAFINGVWSVTEEDAAGNFPPPADVQPNVPLPPPPVPGGVGNWSTTWVP